MTSITLQQANIAATYDDLKDLLHHTVHGIIRQFGSKRLVAWGWDYEEMYHQATLWMVEAHGRFNASRGDTHIPLASRFAVFVKCYIRNRFLDSLRTLNRKESLLPRHHNADLEAMTVSAPKEFDDTSLRSAIGRDAQAVLDVILSLPRELTELEGLPRCYQSTLRGMLVEVGWSVERIGGVLAELSEAVTTTCRI